MTRLTLTLHGAVLHDAAKRLGVLWTVLNPDEGKPQRPWVAHLTGFDDRYTFAREFVRGEYAVYNRKSGKTRDLLYDLHPGLYEVNAPTAYDQADRYFCQVEADGSLTRLTRAEAIVRLGELTTPAAADLAALLTDEDHERS